MSDRNEPGHTILLRPLCPSAKSWWEYFDLCSTTQKSRRLIFHLQAAGRILKGPLFFHSFFRFYAPLPAYRLSARAHANKLTMGSVDDNPGVALCIYISAGHELEYIWLLE